jgi:hypothetical protein
MMEKQDVCDACGCLHAECICNDYEPDYRDDCHYCGGEGWVDGTDEDPWWHGWNHPAIDCPCCGGSGDAKHCRFW